MHLTVLAVPGCPNAVLLEERLTSVLAGHSHVTVSRRLITSAEQAARWGMHGSPTILVNGTDPFAEPGQAASMSCRLYRDAGGRVTGAPTAAQLRRAIEQAAKALPARLVRRLAIEAATRLWRPAKDNGRSPARRGRMRVTAQPGREPARP